MTSPRNLRLGIFVGAGLAVALALAFFVAPRASGEPDGLNKVAIEQGFDETETDHALADSPTAGYAVDGVDDEGLATGLAGLVGVTVTFLVGGGLVLLLRRARPEDPSPDGARTQAG